MQQQMQQQPMQETQQLLKQLQLQLQEKQQLLQKLQQQDQRSPRFMGGCGQQQPNTMSNWGASQMPGSQNAPYPCGSAGFGSVGGYPQGPMANAYGQHMSGQ